MGSYFPAPKYVDDIIFGRDDDKLNQEFDKNM